MTSIGFYDLAIAAPSMKAALEAWGAESNLFHQGAASETTDSKIVANTMASPGIVVRRPVGSKQTFKQKAELPDRLTDNGASKDVSARKLGRARKSRKKLVGRRNADGEAAAASKSKEERLNSKRANEATANLKREQSRKRAVSAAQRKIDAARAKHETNATEIRSRIEQLQKRLSIEDKRWNKESERLQAALLRAKNN